MDSRWVRNNTYKKWRSHSISPSWSSVFPESIEVIFAIVSADAADGLSGVVGDFEGIVQFYEVVIDDEDSIFRIVGIVIRCEDPVVVSLQIISAPNYDIFLAVDLVIVTDEDIVVLDDVLLYLLKKGSHFVYSSIKARENLVSIRVLFSRAAIFTLIISINRRLVIIISFCMAGKLLEASILLSIIFSP